MKKLILLFCLISLINNPAHARRYRPKSEIAYLNRLNNCRFVSISTKPSQGMSYVFEGYSKIPKYSIPRFMASRPCIMKNSDYLLEYDSHYGSDSTSVKVRLYFLGKCTDSLFWYHRNSEFTQHAIYGFCESQEVVCYFDKYFIVDSTTNKFSTIEKPASALNDLSSYQVDIQDFFKVSTLKVGNEKMEAWIKREFRVKGEMTVNISCTIENGKIVRLSYFYVNVGNSKSSRKLTEKVGRKLKKQIIGSEEFDYALPVWNYQYSITASP